MFPKKDIKLKYKFETEWCIPKFELAMLDKNLNLASWMGSCRTYCEDHLWEIRFEDDKKVSDVYDKLRYILAVYNPSSDIESRYNKIIPVLARFNLPIPHIYTTKDDRIYYIEADVIWGSEMWKHSLLTYLLKYILVDESNEYIEYWPAVIDKLLSKVLQDNNEKLYDSMSMNHDYSGFVTLLRENKYHLNLHILGD